MPKVKWVKEIPAKEGWYWIKYKGKNGVIVCPCEVMIFKHSGTIVTTARNDMFTAETRTYFKMDHARFGPEIPFPE